MVLLSRGDGIFKLYDANSTEWLATYNTGWECSCTAAFSPDGTRIASANLQRNIKIWDVVTDKLPYMITDYQLEIEIPNSAYPKQIAFSKDGDSVFIGDGEGNVYRYDSISGTLLQTLQGHTLSVSVITISPDGNLVASTAGGDVKIWDAQSGELLVTIEAHGSSIWSMKFSPDSRRLATSSGDGTVKVWSMDGIYSAVEEWNLY